MEGLERALRINEAQYGPDRAEVAITLANLANAIGDLGDAAKQKELLERALRIKEAHYGLDHVEVAKPLGSLASAIGDLGDAAKKKELLQPRAYVRFKKAETEAWVAALRKSERPPTAEQLAFQLENNITSAFNLQKL